ncbi:MAG: pro-sigmaK processing inhibitor BofA family protein [Oscillospiraceae bacterium]|nr:pro-sigmaK processing inhibitor BofA family protein [Oscillospiraceae bacterium]
MESEKIFYIICGIVSLLMLVIYISRRRRFLSFIFGSLAGMTALFLVCKYGSQIGIEIPLNIFNFCGSGILGIPFVVFLAIICR